MNIFVGNLAKDVSDSDLQDAFSAYGQVRSVKVIRDIFSGESRGFGFVEMPGTADAQKAINELNTKEIKGKKLVVNEARQRTDNRRGGSSGGGPRRGGSGGGRGGFSNRGGSGGGGGKRW